MTAHNPYTPPQANLDDDHLDDDMTYNTLPFYWPTGRIGRVKFLAHNGIWLCLIFVFLVGMIQFTMAFDMPAYVMYLGVPFITYAIITPMTRRLTDLGRSRLWGFLYLVPYLNTLLFLYLIFAKGDDGVNDYGYASTTTKLDMALACIIPTFTLFNFFFAFGGLDQLVSMLMR